MSGSARYGAGTSVSARPTTLAGDAGMVAERTLLIVRASGVPSRTSAVFPPPILEEIACHKRAKQTCQPTPRGGEVSFASLLGRRGGIDEGAVIGGRSRAEACVA